MSLWLAVALVAWGGRAGTGEGGVDVSPDLPAGAEVDAEVAPGEVCTPRCEGRTCGPDGCGGSCGPCADPCSGAADEPGLCRDGQCATPCCPTCGDRECGDDGCGGACGVCAGGTTCSPAGRCEKQGCLAPQCEAQGKVCDPESDACVECLTHGHCPAGKACFDHQCRPVACVPGEHRCGPTGREVCASDGIGWQALPCPPGEPCVEGACKARICVPGDASCQGSVLRSCDELGIAWIERDCEPEGLCRQGACHPRICEPEVATCLGPHLAECAADGTRWEIEACVAGTYCEEGACVPWVCTPGEVQCLDPFTRRACNGTGSGHVELPCPAGRYCEQGACVLQACPPLGAACTDDGRVRRCNPAGSAWEEPVPCLSGTFCDVGSCEPWRCQPDGVTCDGDRRRLCASDGSGDEPLDDCAARGQRCSGGVCTTTTRQVYRLVQIDLLAPLLRADLGGGPVELNALASAYVTAGLEDEYAGDVLGEIERADSGGALLGLRMGSGACLARPESASEGPPLVCGFDPPAAAVHAAELDEKAADLCGAEPAIEAPCFEGEAAGGGTLRLLTVDLAYERARAWGRLVGDPPATELEVVVEAFVPRDVVEAQAFALPDLDLWLSLADVDIEGGLDVVNGRVGWWFRFRARGEPVRRAEGAPLCWPGQATCQAERVVVCDDLAHALEVQEDCAAAAAVCRAGACRGVEVRAWRASHVAVLAPPFVWDSGAGPVDVTPLADAWINSGLGTSGEIVGHTTVSVDDEVVDARVGDGQCELIDDQVACAFAPEASLVVAESIETRLDAPCAEDPAIAAPCFVGSAAGPGTLTILDATLDWSSAELAATFGPGAPVTALIEIFAPRATLEARVIAIGEALVPVSDLVSATPTAEHEGVVGWWFRVGVEGQPVSSLALP